MKILNTGPDKFLIECIEIDLYDLLYRANTQQWTRIKMADEVTDTLQTYQNTGAIVRFALLTVMIDRIFIKIYAPRMKLISCRMP
jgi:hypothetical protein